MTHPGLTLGCANCAADVLPIDMVAGAGRDAGRLVHLVDAGPRHEQVEVHRLSSERSFGRIFDPRPEAWLAAAHAAEQTRALHPITAPLAVPGVVLWTDVSQWQAATYSAAYSYPVAQYRVSLGMSVTDAKLTPNADWCHKRAVAHLLTAHIGYHVWYPGNEQGQADRFLALMAPHLDSRFVAAVDVENWSGAITGDHSDQLNALCSLLALNLGHKRVKVYGNEADLAAIFPRRASWIGLLKAKYSSTPPAEPWDGWQFSDGDPRWPVLRGWPRADAPFGACDHNAFYGSPEQFAAVFGVATPPIPAPQPPAPIPVPVPVFSPVKGDEVILLNKKTGVGVHLQPGGVAVWLHDGADAAAMHAGGVPMAVVSDTLFQTEVRAAGGGRGASATADLLPHFGLSAEHPLGDVSAQQAGER